MTDLADRAQEHEERERAAALARQAETHSEAPMLDADGHRLCTDCLEKIERQRLRAAPQAVRCCECQGRHERFLKTHLASRPVC